MLNISKRFVDYKTENLSILSAFSSYFLQQSIRQAISLRKPFRCTLFLQDYTDTCPEVKGRFCRFRRAYVRRVFKPDGTNSGKFNR
jgi:hypothetical protein